MTTATKLSRNAFALAIIGALTACGSTMGPDGDEPPAPRFETVTDVTLTPRYLTVRSKGACDGNAVISGKPRNGEFQYRVEAHRNGTRFRTLQSSGYGSVTGSAKSAGPGDRINFANETWAFDNLRAGDQVELRFRATEWDATSRDSYMDDLEHSRFFNIPVAAQSVTGATLDLGATSCGLTLHYDLKVTSRQVQVG